MFTFLTKILVRPLLHNHRDYFLIFENDDWFTLNQYIFVIILIKLLFFYLNDIHQTRRIN